MILAASLFGGQAETAAPVLSGAGWQFTERGDLGTVQIVAADHSADTMAKLAGTVGELASTGRTVRTADRTIIGLSPRGWLLQCARKAEVGWIERIASSFPDGLVLPTSLGDHLPWFDLAGEGAESALAQGAFLEIGGAPFRPGMSRRMLLARVPVVLMRLPESVWRLGIERSRAGHFRDWLAALAGAVA